MWQVLVYNKGLKNEDGAFERLDILAKSVRRVA